MKKSTTPKSDLAKRRAAAPKSKPQRKAPRKTTNKAPRKAPAGKPLPAQMLELITAYWTSQMVFVAARLGIADRLADGGRTPAELAAAVGADADRLHRLLRALATAGLFVERADGRFTLTPLGATLRSDAPFSLRNFALMMVDDYNWNAWSKLQDGIEQPITPFERLFDCRVFEYMQRHPEKMRVFGESMSSISAAENPAVAKGYAFGKLEHIVDVGGSQGHLLAAILQQHRGVRGTLFDMPPVIAQAQQAPFLSAKGLAGRVQFTAGDFFTGVPLGADAYVMKYILHDWNDDLCVQILTHCRQAMAKGGRVLVVDTVVPKGNAPHWGKMLDINMLVLTGGRERTQQDFAMLFQRAGLELHKVHATACPLSIIEGVAH